MQAHGRKGAGMDALRLEIARKFLAVECTHAEREELRAWLGSLSVAAAAAVDAGYTGGDRIKLAKDDEVPPDAFGPAVVVAERLSLENVGEVFTFKPWDPFQQAAGKRVVDALIHAAETILMDVPESPLRTRALNDLVDARMKANAAITHRGRF
jgi:hypothetical protein